MPHLRTLEWIGHMERSQIILWEFPLVVGSQSYEELVTQDYVRDVVVSNLRDLLDPVVPASVTDPQKGYHLELATTHLRVSRELHTLLLELGYTPKETTRKANSITYFKQSEAIEDFLTAIGAPIAAMELMNAKAEKLLRNGVNRRVNCEAANVDKTVDAALEQRQAIQALREAGTLDTLSPKLREAAALREAHPELSLAQLAALCDPPVTKSSLSHRLRKLIQLSQAGAGEGGV